MQLFNAKLGYMPLLTHVLEKVVELYLIIVIPGKHVDIDGKKSCQEGQRQLVQS